MEEVDEPPAVTAGQRPGADRWPFATVAVAVAVGAAVGIGAFTFHYAQGTSYLSSASETCANCHVMQDHFDAWVKSSHGRFANCNDCHAPHDFVGKWYCKARNGYFHSLAFTTQNFDEPFRITDYNRGVVEQNCRHCHADFVHPFDSGAFDSGPPAAGRDAVPGHDDQWRHIDCIRCHRDVGHPT